MERQKNQMIENILFNFLFDEKVDFNEILCDDIAYYSLSDENCIAILTKKYLETEK